jgi:hypothetical protein
MYLYASYSYNLILVDHSTFVLKYGHSDSEGTTMQPFAGVREQIRKSRLETQVEKLVDMPPEVLIAIGQYLKDPSGPNLSNVIPDDMDHDHMMLAVRFILCYVEKVKDFDPDAYNAFIARFEQGIRKEFSEFY